MEEKLVLDTDDFKKTNWLDGDFINNLTVAEVITTLKGIREQPSEYEITYLEARKLASDVLGIPENLITKRMFFELSA